MKRLWISTLLTLSLAGNALLVALVVHPVTEARAATSTSTEELSIYMAHLQHLVHKLGLSIQSKNQPLANFYAAELSETFEIVQKKFPQYQGIQVAALSKAMIDPATPALSKALAASNWTAATGAYKNYITACNNCHIAVKHEFIKILVPTGNPFDQSFAPK